MPAAAPSLKAMSILSAHPLDFDLAVTLKGLVAASNNEKNDVAAHHDGLSALPDAEIRQALACWSLDDRPAAARRAAASGHALAPWLEGELARAAGREDEALAHYQKAAALAPTAAPCALAPIESLLRLEREEEALELTQSLRRHFSDKAHLFLLEGRARSKMGQHEQALACYQEAMRVDPLYAPAIFQAALLLDLRGNDAEAKELYAKIGPDRDAPHAHACLNLGLLHDDAGEIQEALRCFRRALQADPRNARAKLCLRDAEASLTMHYSPEETKQTERLDAVLRIPVTDFELSVRSRNCLTTMNIQTLGDLAKKTESEMLAYKNFGETSLREVKEMLSSKGLRLGMMREDAATRAAMERQRRTAEQELLAKSLDTLELGMRARKGCEAMGMTVLGDLVEKTEDELAETRHFGRVVLTEIKKKLAAAGLSLREADPGDGDSGPDGAGANGRETIGAGTGKAAPAGSDDGGILGDFGLDDE